MPAANRTRQTARRLNSLEDIRAGLASVWRRLEAGSLDVQTARTLIYCGSTMAAVVQESDIERRLKEMEAKTHAP